jgi:hypothetical protein
MTVGNGDSDAAAAARSDMPAVDEEIDETMKIDMRKCNLLILFIVFNINRE